MLLRLRPLHPVLAVAAAVFLIFWTGWLKKQEGHNTRVVRWANVLAALVVVQLGFGALTLLTLGPILMQLGHLLLADSIWIAFVLLSANLLTAPSGAGQNEERQLAPSATIASSES
jgi:heme A synthase